MKTNKFKMLENLIRQEVRNQIKEYKGKRRIMSEESNEIDNLSSMPWRQLISLIRKDWKNVYFGAEPYLQALESMSSERSNYMFESGQVMILYFLSNASTWKGPVAKAVKAELKRRSK
jgi:hypothetical protein